MITLVVALANEKRCCNISNFFGLCLYDVVVKFVYVSSYGSVTQCFGGKILKSFVDRVADMFLIRRSPVEGSFVSRRCGHDAACNKAIVKRQTLMLFDSVHG